MIAALLLALALQTDPVIEKVERVAGDVNRALLWTPLRVTLSSAAGYGGDVAARSEFGFATAKAVQIAPGGRTTILLAALDPKEVVAGKAVHKLARDFVRCDRVILVDARLPYAAELTSTPQTLYQKISGEDLQALRPRGLLEAADLILTRENAPTREDADKAVEALGDAPALLEAVDRLLWAQSPRGGWVPTKKTWTVFFAVVYSFSALVGLAVVARRFPKFGLLCVAGVAALGVGGYVLVFPRNDLWTVADRVEDRRTQRTHHLWYLHAASELTTRIEFPLLAKPIFTSSGGTDEPFILRPEGTGCRVEGLKLGPGRGACFGATELVSTARRPENMTGAVLVRNGKAGYLGDLGAEAPLPESVDGGNAGLRSPAFEAWSRFVGKDGLFGVVGGGGATKALVSTDLADERERHRYEIRGVK